MYALWNFNPTHDKPEIRNSNETIGQSVGCSLSYL